MRSSAALCLNKKKYLNKHQQHYHGHHYNDDDGQRSAHTPQSHLPNRIVWHVSAHRWRIDDDYIYTTISHEVDDDEDAIHCEAMPGVDKLKCRQQGRSRKRSLIIIKS